MKFTRTDIMGMPVTVEVVDHSVTRDDIDRIFNYFSQIDEKFSTYKPGSEISKLNRGEIQPRQYSKELTAVLELSEKTKREANGYFDIWHSGICDPSGLVKGWAIKNAADSLLADGFKNFYVEAGGDIQAFGKNSRGKTWQAGIRNPFKASEIVKIVALANCGMATSGSYERGQHIYNPLDDKPITDIVSLSVIGPNVYEADRFATAAFAMGFDGVNFIESRSGLEGYMIDKNGVATMTSGFGEYVQK